jgi:hypothetical protein
MEASFQEVKKGWDVPIRSQHEVRATFPAVARAVPAMLSCFQFDAERASYNGSIEASQASDVGSIPIARSNNLQNSVASVAFTHLAHSVWARLILILRPFCAQVLAASQNTYTHSKSSVARLWNFALSRWPTFSPRKEMLSRNHLNLSSRPIETAALIES